MPTHFTSFQIKNTTTDPMIISVNDPDGNVHTVETLDPGKESLQVAPADASWSIEPLNQGLPENTDSPAGGGQISIAPVSSKIEIRAETSLLPLDSIDSELTHYEAFLRLETGAHTSRVNQLLVTPDGKTLVTSGGDKTIRVWDVETRKQIGMLLGEIGAGSDGKIQAIALSRDGRYIVALAWRNPPGALDDDDRETDVRVYELATANLQAGFRYPGTLQDLDFSPDGRYLAIVGNPAMEGKRKDEERHGNVYIYHTESIVNGGFGEFPAPLASDVLFRENTLIPSYVRFIPEEIGDSAGARLVVATWIHHFGGDPEYTGKLIWYSYSGVNGLVKNVERDIEGHVTPESLTVSRDYAILTAHHGDPKSFYCYDHSGGFVGAVSSESNPAQPVFSNDESQLIVGQRGDSALVQVKVYNTALGQFQLKSTYYGHDSEVVAVALLQDGTAVSAGGDQNAIHFWSTSHMEGEKTAEIKGVGRVVHAVGINSAEQIGIGNHDDLLLDDHSIVLPRVFDLHAMTLSALSIKDAPTFRRAQTQLGERYMQWMERGGYTNLYLIPDYEPFTGVSPVGWYYPSTFGFTENGTIVTGASDGKIRVAPLQPDGNYNTPVRLLIGHSARVVDHAACGRWLVTAGADQIIRLWFMDDVDQDSLEPLEPALNLFVGSDDEWVIWSKSGYYNASQQGDRYIGYHVNRGPGKEALYFSSDRFHNVFFRPDIIQAILFYGSEERVSKKETESGISIKPINVAEILPPIIELDEDGVKEFESEDKEAGFVSFTLTVQSQGKPITRLCVLRNGRLLHVEKSVPTYGKLTISGLPLLPGENRFKIYAENQDAQSHIIKSNPIEQTIIGKARYEDQAVLENGMLYILAIGVSTAKNLKKRTREDEEGFFELNYADKDANAVFDAVTKDNKAFEGVEKTLLLNEQATLASIKKALDDINQKINKKVEERITNQEGAKRDVLLVYLSGHGVFRIKNQQLYFWNYDFDLEKPGDTGLAFMDLGEKITSLPAEVILMTDACHSGMAGSDVVTGFDPDKNGIDPNELAKRIYGINEIDMYIFNAARRSESALEGRSVEHGYFTKAILDALLESTNLGVTMIGLIDQVQWGVQRYTTAQNPVCRMYGDLLPLVIYRK
jgi:WD40 repeat protein